MFVRAAAATRVWVHGVCVGACPGGRSQRRDRRDAFCLPRISCDAREKKGEKATSPVIVVSRCRAAREAPPKSVVADHRPSVLAARRERSHPRLKRTQHPGPLSRASVGRAAVGRRAACPLLLLCVSPPASRGRSAPPRAGSRGRRRSEAAGRGARQSSAEAAGGGHGLLSAPSS